VLEAADGSSKRVSALAATCLAGDQSYWYRVAQLMGGCPTGLNSSDYPHKGLSAWFGRPPDHSRYRTRGIAFSVRHIVGTDSEAWAVLMPWVNMLDKVVECLQQPSRARDLLPAIGLATFSLLSATEKGANPTEVEHTMLYDIMRASLEGATSDIWPMSIMRLLVAKGDIPADVEVSLKLFFLTSQYQRLLPISGGW